MTNISFGLDIDIFRKVFQKDICFDKKEQVYPTRVMVGVGWWISTSSRQGCSLDGMWWDWQEKEQEQEKEQ